MNTPTADDVRRWEATDEAVIARRRVPIALFAAAVMLGLAAVWWSRPMPWPLLSGALVIDRCWALFQLAARKPLVVIAREGIAVGGHFRSARSRNRAVCWTDVEHISDVGLSPWYAADRDSRLSTWPSWVYRLPFTRSFSVLCSDGRSLRMGYGANPPMNERLETLRASAVELSGRV